LECFRGEVSILGALKLYLKPDEMKYRNTVIARKDFTAQLSRRRYAPLQIGHTRKSGA
jgi:hypothetical protein